MNIMNASRQVRLVISILLVSAQGFVLLGLVLRGNRDFVYNIIGSTACWIVYTICEHFYAIGIPVYVQGLVAAAIISDGFLGFYLNLYVLSPFFDRLQHILGAYALSLFFYFLIVNALKITIQHRWIRFLFIVAIGISVGALYEIIEFFSDSITKPQLPNQPSLEDTDLDLISNAMGAILAGFHSLFFTLSNIVKK